MMECGEGWEPHHSELYCKKRIHFQQVLVVSEDIPGRKDTKAGNRGSEWGTLGVIQLSSAV